LDGALYHNNPARVAYQEYKLLWPDIEGQAPDIMLSIGSSWVDKGKEPRNTEARPHKIAINRLDNLLDAQIAWEQFEQEVQEPGETKNSRYIRINPKLQMKFKLDDVKKLQQLKEKVKYTLGTPKSNINMRNVARRLISSSFFFEKDHNLKHKDIIQGTCHFYRFSFIDMTPAY
jgi:hypothetical protein